jgi:hypothetical protein
MKIREEAFWRPSVTDVVFLVSVVEFVFVEVWFPVFSFTVWLVLDELDVEEFEDVPFWVEFDPELVFF